MKSINKIFLFGLALGALALNSCHERQVTSEKDISNVEVDSTKTSVLNVAGELFGIPSPIQTAILVKNSGAPFEADRLGDPQRAGALVSRTDMALNMGIAGTDMAYASLYNDGQRALKQFKALETLAEKLEVKGAIDVELMKRLGGHVGNADSLLILSGQFYRAADAYLKENDRIDIATLVLAGGWIESTYLTIVAAESGTDEAKQRIAEQKVTIETLCNILHKLEDENLTDSPFMNKMDSLNMTYTDVVRTYSYSPSVTNAEAKKTTIKSQTIFIMKPETQKEISSRVSELRQLILQAS